MCLVRLFTASSFPSGPRFSRVVFFVRSSSFVSGFRFMSRSILLVRVVCVSSSRRLSCFTVFWSPAMCFMFFVGYVVNVAWGFFLLACLQCIHFLLFLYRFSSFYANHQLAPRSGASWLFLCVVFSLCLLCVRFHESVDLCVSSSAEHERFSVHCFFCGYVVLPCSVLASALWVDGVCCALVVVCFSVCACFYCCGSFDVAPWLLSFHVIVWFNVN